MTACWGASPGRRLRWPLCQTHLWGSFVPRRVQGLRLRGGDGGGSRVDPPALRLPSDKQPLESSRQAGPGSPGRGRGRGRDARLGAQRCRLRQIRTEGLEDFDCCRPALGLGGLVPWGDTQASAAGRSPQSRVPSSSRLGPLGRATLVKVATGYVAGDRSLLPLASKLGNLALGFKGTMARSWGRWESGLLVALNGSPTWVAVSNEDDLVASVTVPTPGKAGEGGPGPGVHPTDFY